MKKVTWRTEVADVIVHPNGLIVAIVKGFPLTLDRAEGQPQEDVVIKTSDSKFFLIPHEDVDLPGMNTMKRSKTPVIHLMVCSATSIGFFNFRYPKERNSAARKT